MPPKNLIVVGNDAIVHAEDNILHIALTGSGQQNAGIPGRSRCWVSPGTSRQRPVLSTNAITPALKVLDDVYGVERGHVETVHAFTNDQNLIDNFHKGDRRGRSAVLNMVITETGALVLFLRHSPSWRAS